MQIKRMGVLRGWVTQRNCERCFNAITRDDMRFHCNTCKADLCVTCASAGHRAAEQHGFRIEQTAENKSNGEKQSLLAAAAPSSGASTPRHFANGQHAAQGQQSTGHLLASSLVPATGKRSSTPIQQRAANASTRAHSAQASERSSTPLQQRPSNFGTHGYSAQASDRSSTPTRRPNFGAHVSSAQAVEKPGTPRRARPSAISTEQHGQSAYVPEHSPTPTQTQAPNFGVHVSSTQVSGRSATPTRAQPSRNVSKSASVRITLVREVEWIFYDEDEGGLEKAIHKFVPLRPDGQAGRWRSPDQVRSTWSLPGQELQRFSVESHGTSVASAAPRPIRSLTDDVVATRTYPQFPTQPRRVLWPTGDAATYGSTLPSPRTLPTQPARVRCDSPARRQLDGPSNNRCSLQYQQGDPAVTFPPRQFIAASPRFAHHAPPLLA